MKIIKIIIIDDRETVEIKGKAENVYIQKSLFQNEMGIAINLIEVRRKKFGDRNKNKYVN